MVRDTESISLLKKIRSGKKSGQSIVLIKDNVSNNEEHFDEIAMNPALVSD